MFKYIAIAIALTLTAPAHAGVAQLVTKSQYDACKEAMQRGALIGAAAGAGLGIASIADLYHMDIKDGVATKGAKVGFRGVLKKGIRGPAIVSSLLWGVIGGSTGVLVVNLTSDKC